MTVRIVLAWSALAVLLVLCGPFDGAVARAAQVGPSFACAPAPIDALSRLSCSDARLARADLGMVQTYYALRQSVGSDGQGVLKSQFLAFIIDTRRRCGLPPVQPGRDQSAVTLPDTAAACVTAFYDRQRAVWATRLSGPAREEAARAPEQNVALQARLQALGLLAQTATIDGVFGTGTRNALLSWQHSAGRPETGFFGDADAVALLGASAGATKPGDPLADLRVPPLAQVTFDGAPASVNYKTMRATLGIQDVEDAAVCHDSKGGLLGLNSAAAATGPCKAVVLSIAVDDRDVFKDTAALVASPADVLQFQIKASLRRLDPKTALPQVVLTGYSGGAHCCTSTTVITSRPDGSWQAIGLDSVDGDGGYDFLDPTHDGGVVLVNYGGGFAYHYASGAGSYAPSRILRVSGTAVEDVTSDPVYRSFLVRQLGVMEQERAKYPSSEPNGYLAGWVAQKALVGQLSDAWRTMLRTYDHGSSNGLSECAVDARVWTKSPYGSGTVCPAGQDVLVPFPENLALFLVHHRYITAAQSTELGYDPVRIAADRQVAMATATASYEARMADAWFEISHQDVCVAASRPASPAELVTADRARGLEDTIRILEKDGDKAQIVRIGQPKGDDLEMISIFYRGRTRCEDVRQRRRKELEELK